MTKSAIGLQDLRRRIYVKAKAKPTWRFWGLYVHVCKMEMLQEAYQMAKNNNGAPGIDGVTFNAIEERGVEGFLKQTLTQENQVAESQIQILKFELDYQQRRRSPVDAGSNHDFTDHAERIGGWRPVARVLSTARHRRPLPYLEPRAW